MSKWGKEEKETLDILEKMKVSGIGLNIAAGDGRFNNKLLERANKIVAIDINERDLEILKNNCPDKFKDKLYIRKMDIRDKFPFQDEEFDFVFCIGTLHFLMKKHL